MRTHTEAYQYLDSRVPLFGCESSDVSNGCGSQFYIVLSLGDRLQTLQPFRFGVRLSISKVLHKGLFNSPTEPLELVNASFEVLQLHNPISCIQNGQRGPDSAIAWDRWV